MLALLLVGCTRIRDVEFRDASVPGTGVVTFRTGLDGPAEFRFGEDEDHLGLSSAPGRAEDGALSVRGLVAGTAYVGEVVVGEHRSRPIAFTAAPPPDGIPSMTQAVWSPDESCLDGGYVLFGYIGGGKSGVGIVDRAGQYVWAVAPDAPNQVGRARPSRDGLAIEYNTADEAKASDLAHLYRQAIDGGDPLDLRTPWAHHDFVELPDGATYAYPAYDIREVDPIPQGDPGSDTHPVDSSAAGCVAAEAIDEVDGESGVVTRIWDTWDDYAPGAYRLTPDSHTFLSFPCADAGFDTPQNETALEFQHANSLAYLESRDAYYESWRWLDTFAKITRAGELAWTWGGIDGSPAGDLTPTNPDDPPPRHAHFSDVWDDGRLVHFLVFDNGAGRDDSFPREYVVDEAAKTWSLVWTGAPSDSDLVGHDDLLGDVRRMQVDGCDHRLVTYAQKGVIVEMAPDGRIVWELDAGFGTAIGRAYFVPDLNDLSGLAYPE